MPEETPNNHGSANESGDRQPKAPKTEGSTSAPKGGFGPEFMVQVWERLLDRLRGVLSEDMFRNLAKHAIIIGNWALVGAACLVVIAGLVQAIKFESFAAFLTAIGSALTITVLQYTAAKFLNAGDSLIAATPTQLSTRGFVDSIGLVCVVLAILSLVGGTVTAIQIENALPFFNGLIVFLVLGFVLWIALNPSLATTGIDPETSAGEEAIGVLSFLMKSALRLVPIAFAVAAALGAVLLLIGGIQLLGGGSSHAVEMLVRGVGLAVIGAAIPFFVYVAFLLYYLSIALLRAVLIIPGKLDELKRL